MQRLSTWGARVVSATQGAEADVRAGGHSDVQRVVAPDLAVQLHGAAGERRVRADSAG